MTTITDYEFNKLDYTKNIARSIDLDLEHMQKHLESIKGYFHGDTCSEYKKKINSTLKAVKTLRAI